METLELIDYYDGNTLRVETFGNKQNVYFIAKDAEKGHEVQVHVSHKDVKSLIKILKTNKY